MLEEYFDGESYRPLEIDNLAELTRISKEILFPVIEKLVADGMIVQGSSPQVELTGQTLQSDLQIKRRK